GLATSILASRRGHELLGLVACAATGLLVSPISWSHHYVYVVPALALAAYGPRRPGCRILGAALVAGLFGWWPLPIGPQGGYDPTAPLRPRGWLLLAPNRGNNGTAEFTWHGPELIAGNYYVLTLLVFIAATAGALTLTRHLGGKVRELRFHLLAQQTRVTYWLAPGRRVILLTVFRKTRSAETAEVSRAQQAQKICETEHRPAHVTFDREVP
ncbi:MAG TPA: type II toxin-antitoxin system RelE/ParE family toxin, partial [Streptosporangiaceae bacterium]